MKVSFVIPIWNNFHLINELLVGISNHCTPDEIIVVDDCSTDQKTLNGLSWWEFNHNVKVHRPIENLGFLKASNYGLQKATGDILCLISSDVKIEEDLAKIVRDLVTVDPKRLIGGIIHSHDTGWNTFNEIIFPYVEGWLLCATKAAWEELGYFDAQYSPSDMEDVDISTTAAKKGYGLYAIHSEKISHIGAATIGYTEERRKITEINKEKFRQKWVEPILEAMADDTE